MLRQKEQRWYCKFPCSWLLWARPGRYVLDRRLHVFRSLFGDQFVGVGYVEWDYCYRPAGGGGGPPEQPDDVLKRRSPTCSQTRPCQKCEGDCDNDSECVGNLKCFDRRGSTGTADAPVPGCSGLGRTGACRYHLVGEGYAAYSGKNLIILTLYRMGLLLRSFVWWSAIASRGHPTQSRCKAMQF